MSYQDDIKKLITNHHRRLQKLREQQALYGISADPRILLEIEDIEAKIERLQTNLEETEDDITEVSSSVISHAVKKTSQDPRARKVMTNDFTTNIPPVDFVIITPLEEERDAILSKLSDYQKLGPFNEDINFYFSVDLPVTFPDHSMGTYRIVVMPLLEMGRVRAAVSTNDAIRRWNPRYVILVGIAGGVAKKGVKLGDVIVANQIIDYELQKLTSDGPDIRWQVYQTDPRFIGAARNLIGDEWQKLITVQRPERGQPNRHVGPIASGDKVIAFDETLAKYREQWSKLVGVEMEAGGVAVSVLQAAMQPKFFMIRAVSDLADKNKGMVEVEQWRPYVCDVAAAYTIGLLQSGPIRFKKQTSDQQQQLLGDTEMKNLQVEIEHLLEVLDDLRVNLRITQENIRKFGLGSVPLNLTRQEMDIKKQIQKTEEQIKDIDEKLSAEFFGLRYRGKV